MARRAEVYTSLLPKVTASAGDLYTKLDITSLPLRFAAGMVDLRGRTALKIDQFRRDPSEDIQDDRQSSIALLGKSSASLVT